MDVLSDVLLAVRLTGAVFFDVDARSPFATESPGADRIGEQVMGTADRVIGFHVVTEGTCWAETVDGPDPAVRLQAGEMVIFPAGDAERADRLRHPDRGAPDAAQYWPVDRLLPLALTAGRDAAADRCPFVCGFLRAATPNRSTRCSRHCRASSAPGVSGGELALGRPPAGRRGGHRRARRRRPGGDAHASSPS